jgi:hypothetical protein
MNMFKISQKWYWRLLILVIGTILLSSIEELVTAPPYPVDVGSLFGSKLLVFMLWPPWPLFTWPLIVCAVCWVVGTRWKIVLVLIYFIGLSVLYGMEISADARRDVERNEEQKMKAEMWEMMEELSGGSLPQAEAANE